MIIVSNSELGVLSDNYKNTILTILFLELQVCPLVNLRVLNYISCN